MAKRVDSLKAKQARQKKLAIGLSLVLVLVVAYQGPKTLKMLKGPQVPAAATTEAPVVTPAPAGTSTTPAATPTPDTTPQPAILADSDTPVDAEDGQLLSFERFESRDPFQQQVDLKDAETVDSTAPDADSSTGSGSSDPTAPDGNSAVSGGAENPPLSEGGTGSAGSGSAGSGSAGSGSSGSGAAAPGKVIASATTISVNGVVSTVTLGTPFPTDQPTFQLVSIAKNGKSVQIGVAGGSLSSGNQSVKLVLGKPLTLENTADGTRYRLVLMTVEGAPTPAG